MHHISGYIADHDMLQGAVVGFGFKKAKIIKLQSNNLAFLPCTDELVDEMLHNKINRSHRLRTRRLEFPIAYIETDYFGGGGTQWARVVHGQDTPLGKGTIDQALNILGVLRTKEKDEFDIVGLGKHRLNEDWVNKN